MKKKVLYGFAMALIASVSMGTLQSCKDDLSDFKHQYNYDQAGLLQRVSDLEDAVKACKENCRQEIDALERRVTTNEGNIADIQDALNKLPETLSNYVTYTRLQEILADLKVDLSDYYTKEDVYNKQEIAELINKAKEDIKLVTDALSSKMDEIGGKVGTLEETVAGLDETLGKLSDQVDLNEAAIAGINEKLATYDETLRTLNGKLMLLEPQIEGIAEEVAGLQEKIVELQRYIEEAFQAIEQNQIFMTQMLQVIEDKFNELTGRIDNLITGIVLQGTDSPVFGNLNTPLGIQSNILFNWYGYNDVEAFDFPSASADYNYYEGAPVLTQAELTALAPEYKKVKDGVLGDVNLGKLYMTINPAGHLFNEDGFKLETTAENQFPATLTVKKSKDELTFGYTRATVEGNGFYEAEVVVKEADIPAARFDIQDGLKSTVEDALKTPSKRNAVALLKGVYSQLNGTLPAYAVRYDWSNDGKDYSVLSNYAVAAATAKPLSYSFLYGKGTDKKIRTFGHIDNFIRNLIDKNLNTIKIQGQDMEVLGHKIGFAKGDVSISKYSEAMLKAEVTGITVDGNEIASVVALFEDPAEASLAINKEISKALAAAIGKAGDRETEAKFETSVSIALLQMQKQINDVLDEVNGQIHDAIDNISDTAESYAKRLNRLVDLYNKVANKINGFLSNPNHYLQVAMFYNQANSNMGLLSNSLASPTVFTRGNGNFCLYASSYTGELVCPAYMKYVAVTNVYDAKTKKVAENAEAERNAVNSAANYFNTVMSGNTIRYAVPASALKNGLIYEIVYQGVDYSGRTSTQKFYIQVK